LTWRVPDPLGFKGPGLETISSWNERWRAAPSFLSTFGQDGI
jgi:hypothetical protein